MNTRSSRGRSRHSGGASSVAHVQDSQRRAPRSNGASYADMRADQHDDSGEPAVPSHETSMRQLREANEAQNQQIAAQAQEIAILRAQLEVTQAQIRHVLEARRDSTSIDRMPTPHGHVDAHSMNPLQPIPSMQNATTIIGSNSTGSSHILDQTAGSMSGSHTSATTSPASAHAHVIPEVSVGSSLVGTAQVPELVSLLLQACQGATESASMGQHRNATRSRVTFREEQKIVPAFSGDSDDLPVARWLEIFEEIAQSGKWSDYEKRIAARSAFTGAVADWIQSQDPYHSWDALSRDLREEFERISHPMAAYQQLKMLRMKPDEKAIQYLNRAKKLGKAASVSEEQVRHYIMHGLGGPALSKQLMMHAKGWGEFRDALLEYVELRNSDRPSNRVGSNSERTVVPESGNFKRKFPYPREGTDSSTSQKSKLFSHRNGDRKEHPAQEYSRGITDDVCYNCYKPGHMARFCSEKRSSREPWRGFKNLSEDYEDEVSDADAEFADAVELEPVEEG